MSNDTIEITDEEVPQQVASSIPGIIEQAQEKYSIEGARMRGICILMAVDNGDGTSQVQMIQHGFTTHQLIEMWLSLSAGASKNLTEV